MSYNKMHNITKKDLVHTVNNEQKGYVLDYNYDNELHPNAPNKIAETGKAIPREYAYDGNGNPTGYTEEKSFRKMTWDEENRLSGINDNGRIHQFTYDASGERVIKSSGDSQNVAINGETAATIVHTDDYTGYVSPYFVISKGKFTKHYFEGAGRIVSKLGNGSFAQPLKLTAGGVNYSKLTAEQQKALDNYVRGLGVPPGPPTQQGIYATPEFTGDPYPSEVLKPVEENQEPPEGWPRNPVFNAPGDVPGPPVQFGPPVEPTTVKPGEGFTGIGLPENDIFYFHPDHLGSTSYITTRNGSISQHVEYIAFGEVLFEEHSSSFSSPYLFNGKELDRETNLSYYGARYLDMKTSLWLSVDIMASRYPEISPYAYCGNDPVNAIDPDGKDIIYLNSSTAVHGFGHAAVLIGNDRDGWRYLSMNGTGEGAAASGTSKFADLGNIKYDKNTQTGNDFRGTGLTATQVMKEVNNSNPEEDHDYDRAIRVVTNSFEDGLAYAAAKKQAGLPDYNLFGSSCIDVPQEALEAVVAHRLNVQSKKDPQFWDTHLSFYDANKYGFHMLAPNDWYNDLLGGMFNNFVESINSDLKTNPIQVRKMPVTTVIVGPIEE